MTLATRPRSILITLTIASAAVAYSLVIFRPSQKSLVALRHQLRDQQQQIIDADRLLAVITQTETQLTAARQFTEEWEATAPTEGRLAEVFRQFATFAERSKIQLTGIRPQSHERLRTVSQFRVALDCSGSYSGLFDFVHQVETSVPALWIQQFEVTRTDPLREELQCKLLVTIFVDNPPKIADNRQNSG